MAHKQARRAEIKGCGSGGRSQPGSRADMVTMHLEVSDAKDAGRPIIATMTPDDARKWAALLVTMADMIDVREEAQRKAEGA